MTIAISSESVVIVVPGDEPVQIAGSPQLDRLREYGRVELYATRPASDAEKVQRAVEAVCLINSRGAVKWPGEVLRQLPKLKLIAVCGIGTDAIDLPVARQLGITVCNLPGRTAPVVAEHAFGLMFAAAKRAAFQTMQLKAGRWSGMSNLTLVGKTLGLIGAGPIAAQMARLSRAVGMRVLAWTFHPSAERAARIGVEFHELEELLRESDVVSVHLPLTPESRRLIGRRELEWMKPGSLLVNTARGAVVDELALVSALNSGHLAGAALDVFDREPLPADHPLLGCDQVVLTPHNADQTPEGIELLNSGVVDNVIAYLKGKPQNVVGQT
jgi:D-3-phosphoglycerate dehydrogenase